MASKKKNPPPIVQRIELPDTAEGLFWTYLSPQRHGEITGGKVKFSETGKFSAFDGMLLGEFLYIEEGKLIVQTWRSSHWGKSDPDSILMLRFRDEGRDKGVIELVHENVPQHDHQGVTKGWKSYYWEPWKKYLQSQRRPRQKPARMAKRRRS